MPSPVHRSLQQLAREHPDHGVAAFDADGTLWEGDVAEDFLLWMIGEGHVDGRRWTVYDSTQRHDVPESCRELLRSFAGMDLSVLRGHVERFWQVAGERVWQPRVCSAVREARAAGFTTCVVSASPTLVLAPVRRHLPVDHVLGLDAELRDGRLTGEVKGVASIGTGKATRVAALGGPLLLAVGDSELDVALLRASAGAAWAVNPDPALQDIAEQHGWLVTFESM